MVHIFIIGSKGIPAAYGGFETFVEKITFYRKSQDIQYHVACMGNEDSVYRHNGARCFQICVPDIGPAKAVYYDISAFFSCVRYIRKNHIENPVIYILACRIGPFLAYLKTKLGSDGKVFINPDGHEWMRGKWNKFIRKYWKISERYMIKNADVVICDSKNMQKYIDQEYRKYKKPTVFIPYGAETGASALEDYAPQWIQWKEKYQIRSGEYYLIVGRFVPENNYLTMVKEFCASNTERDLVIITNTDNPHLLKRIEDQVDYHRDTRVKFTGTVYDQELLKKIRENAYAYIHGHEVGGTNPSLLEALACTPVNLLLDVGFNREVGEGGALYWNKNSGNLSKLINRAERLTEEEVEALKGKAVRSIRELYNWNNIVEKYEKLFLHGR